MLAAVPVLTALLMGSLLVRALGPACGAGPRWARLTFEFALAAGLGIGITSILFFGMLLEGWASAPVILLVDAVVILGLGALVFLRRGHREPGAYAQPAATTSFRWNWVLALALAAAVSLVLSAMWKMAESNPHGLWDAWAIWNVRARFLAGPGEVWRNAISPLLSQTHPDYPLLLSGFIARAWKVSGDYSAVVPIATALVFFGATLALVVSAVALLRGTSAGLLAGIVLLSNVSFLTQPMAQYADVPLAFYYLASFALAALAWSASGAQKRILLAMSGFSVALAAWTKNEGILFAAAFGACYALAEWRSSGLKSAVSRLSFMAMGVLPGVCLVGLLKLWAPKADAVIHGGAAAVASGVASGAALAGQMDWLLHSAFEEVLNLGSGLAHPLLIVLILLVALRVGLAARDRVPALFGTAVLLLVFLGYCAVSLVAYTPFERFYAQLWPAFLFVLFLLLRPLEQTLTAPVAAAAPDSRARKTKGRRA